MRKLKGIILVVLLIASVLMPFNVYADTNIVPSYSSTSVQNQFQNYEGSVSNYCFDAPTTGNVACKLTFTFHEDLYGQIYFDAIFGSYATLSYEVVNITGGVGEYNYRTYSTSPYQVTAVKIQMLNLATTGDKSTLMWLFPVESYSAVSFAMNNLELSGIIPLNQYKYPIFDVVQYDNLFDVYLSSSQTVELIFYASFNITNSNGLINYVITNGLSIQSIELIALVQNDIQGTGRFYRVILGGGTGRQYYIQANRAYKFMPIFCARNIDSIRNYISTDFALQWGLTNSYLDNIAKIANGTSGSSSAVTDVDSQNLQFESDRDDLIDIEDNFNEDMNDKLDVIDTNTGVSGFGGYFMNSAVWVRTQFDRLTNNTPYGSLIIYGMTLGLALLLLGKVFL